ncbi:MAG: hypothetical protein C9356_00180 [Oleiphilus sp.]|nr:MAG: hypothetical protein C9356_00180 [Oleiphilus sp.]
MATDVIHIYGIKNCDTMKKALVWLTNSGIDFVFHDYKKEGVDADRIRYWLTLTQPEDLINRRGTSWRKLSEEARSNLTQDSATQLIIDNPSLVKRPLLELGDEVYLGFKPELYSSLFNLSQNP